MLFVIVGLDAAEAANEECSLILPLEQVLQNPESHNGKQTCAAGVLNVQFEGDALIWGRSRVWLAFYRGPPWTEDGIDRDKKLMDGWNRQFQHTCVVIKGTFDREETGHFGMFASGGIKNILSIFPYSGQCLQPNPALQRTPQKRRR